MDWIGFVTHPSASALRKAAGTVASHHIQSFASVLKVFPLFVLISVPSWTMEVNSTNNPYCSARIENYQYSPDQRSQAYVVSGDVSPAPHQATCCNVRWGECCSPKSTLSSLVSFARLVWRSFWRRFLPAKSAWCKYLIEGTGYSRVVDDCTLRFNDGGETLRSGFLFSGILVWLLALYRTEHVRCIGILLQRRTLRWNRNSIHNFVCFVSWELAERGTSSAVSWMLCDRSCLICLNLSFTFRRVLKQPTYDWDYMLQSQSPGTGLKFINQYMPIATIYSN